MLTIEDLTVSLNNKIIIKNLSLKINVNETHILLGPNGCGKSTLSKIIAGFPSYSIDSGKIYYKGQNLLLQSVEERALNGIFLGFQQPIEIPGATNFDFLYLIYNEKQKHLNEKKKTPLEFLSLLNQYLLDLNMDASFLDRNINVGFSGGEKKKNEILQLLILSPELIILDELDSGVDIDSLAKICSSITKYSKKKNSYLLITHSSRLLKYFNLSYAHLMLNKTIIKTGKEDLVNDVFEKGFSL